MKRSLYLLVGVAAIWLVVGAGNAYAYHVLSPDDRAVHSPAAISAARSADIAPDDRVLHRPGMDPTPLAVPAKTGERFDWIDAGIGAGTVLGLALLGMGAFVVVTRRRRGVAYS
jgi:hypothetical protein